MERIIRSNRHITLVETVRVERIIRSTGGTDNPFHFGHLGGLSVLPVEQIIKPRTEVLEKVVEAAMQVEEDLPDPEKNLPHSETEVQTKPQKKKVTFSLRKKKSVENSKKRKLFYEGNSEIEQVREAIKKGAYLWKSSIRGLTPPPLFSGVMEPVLHI